MDLPGAFLVVSFEDRQFDWSTMRIEGVFETYRLAEKSISDYQELLRSRYDSSSCGDEDYYRYFGIQQYQMNKLGYNKYYIAWNIVYYSDRNEWNCSPVRNIGVFNYLNNVTFITGPTIHSLRETIYSIYVHSYFEDEALKLGQKLILDYIDKL